MIPLVAAAGSVLGPVKGLLGGVFGGGPRDPTADSRARSLVASGYLVKLGKVTSQPWTRPVPDPGEFYLDTRDGEIYQSKASGLYPVTATWAVSRKSEYLRTQVSLSGSSNPFPDLFPAKAGAGFAVVLLVSIAVVVFFLVGRK